MASHHVFQSFWLQPRLTPLEQLCISSFLAHGHRFAVYSYKEIENLPDGCDLKDARQILPEESVFSYSSGTLAGSVAAFANVFRCKLLLDRGGWWVDTDTLCLKSDIPETPYVLVRIDDETYANGILKAPRGSEFMATAFTRAQAYGKDVEWLANGPRLITALVEEFDLGSEAWETRDLVPLSWDEALGVLDPDRCEQVEETISGSTFLHLWNQMFMAYNILKTVRPPKGSFLLKMYERYGVRFPLDPQYEFADLAPQIALEKEHWTLFDEVARLREELRAAKEPPQKPRRRWNRLGAPLTRRDGSGRSPEAAA